MPPWPRPRGNHLGSRSYIFHTKVEVIPDTLQGLDPREAITRLMVR
jgi:hypothetical protein